MFRCRDFAPVLIAASLVSPSATGQDVWNEQELPAAEGWVARSIHEGEAGIWYVHTAPLVSWLGPQEVLGYDDDGKVLVLSGYSGRWTARHVNPDGQWLAPSGICGVDPNVAGRQLYAGGRAGSLHRIDLRREARSGFSFTSTELAHLPGDEIHAIVAGDFRAERPGDELVLFTLNGGVHELLIDEEGRLPPRLQLLFQASGRFRQAITLPSAEGGPTYIVAVGRHGKVLRFHLRGEITQLETVLTEDCGLGRIAKKPSQPGQPPVLYVTRDDGTLLRLQGHADESFTREVIFAGEPGLRGVAAGRFFAERDREGVAVFGYGKKVHLVSRAAEGPWSAETIYSDADRGHWLEACELDGRNATTELLASGFGGRIVLLGRDPGVGLEGVATPPRPAKKSRGKSKKN